MGDRPDPRRTMHPDPVLADDRLVRVNSHAGKHLDALRPRVLGQGALGEHSRAECRVGPFEREEERVALIVDLAAALLLDGLAQDSMMHTQGSGIALAQWLQGLGRDLDLGEEERICAARQVRRSSFSLRLAHVLTRERLLGQVYARRSIESSTWRRTDLQSSAEAPLSVG
jgi:hypothetical protein